MPSTVELIKFGFLLQCAQEGLTQDQIDVRIKAATELLQKQAEGGIMSALADAAGHATSFVPWSLKTLGGAIAGQQVAGSPALGAVAANPEAVLTAGKYGLGALGAIGGVGAGLGYGAARLTEDDTDPAEIKQQELAETYRQQADYLQQQRVLHQLQSSAGRRLRAPSLRSRA